MNVCDLCMAPWTASNQTFKCAADRTWHENEDTPFGTHLRGHFHVCVCLSFFQAEHSEVAVWAKRWCGVVVFHHSYPLGGWGNVFMYVGL